MLARSLFDNRGKDDFGDRILASIPFLLPLLDGLPYGELARFGQQITCGLSYSHMLWTS